MLRFSPDLVVVCFGLNDANKGLEELQSYREILTKILGKLKNAECEVIFMTPNMMNTDVSVHITDPVIRNIARGTAMTQNDGDMDAYMDAAREVCVQLGVPVCDCYAKWKLLYQNGVNITEILANKINHPTRAMNWLFAVSLLETMMTEA